MKISRLKKARLYFKRITPLYLKNRVKLLILRLQYSRFCFWERHEQGKKRRLLTYDEWSKQNPRKVLFRKSDIDKFIIKGEK